MLRRVVLVLAFSLLVIAFPRPAAAEQYYAQCKGCVEHGLGGSGYIGPFPTEADCEREAEIERKQGLPIGGCSTSRTAITGAPRSRGGVITLATLGGVVAGGLVGSAMSSGGSTTFTDYERNYMVNSAAVGGGLVLATAGAINAKGLGPAGTAAAVGIGAAAAAAGASRNMALNGAPDNTLRNTVIAGAAGVGGGIVLGKVAESLAPGMRLPGGARIAVTGRQFWLRWMW